MLQVQRFTFNQLAVQTYLVYDETKDCVIVDPGCSRAEEEEELTKFIAEQGLGVTLAINTHGHVDHVIGNAYVKRVYGAPLAIHPQEVSVLQQSPKYALLYGIPPYEPTEVDLFLEAGDKVRVGKDYLQVLHLPGHSPGHIALYSPTSRFCLVGDVLCKSFLGRTDLPGGDRATLLRSIYGQLFLLDEQVILYPGHGPETTIELTKWCYPPPVK
jgi:glyoxylase-like metal-dependent hydrolase (beta-lactamase superfamily II)